MNRFKSPLSIALLSFAIALAPHADAFAAQTAAPAAVKVDAKASGLFGTLSIAPNATSINWSVCGQANGESGCFGGAQLGPFGHVCAAYTDPDNWLYVADSADPTSKEMMIHIYKLVVSSSPVATVEGKVLITEPAEANPTCYMAATQNYLYFATNQTKPFTMTRAKPFLVSTLSAFDGPTTGISASSDYAIVNQGSGFTLYDVNNKIQEDGGEISNVSVAGSGLITPLVQGAVVAP